MALLKRSRSGNKDDLTSSRAQNAKKGRVQVVRTMTLPNGQKIRVMRKDAFARSIKRDRSLAPV